MSQDSSLVGEFDLKTQAGVMSVLAAIRASSATAADKNELRDLVFSYTNGGGDASVRILLEQKLIAHHIVPVVMQQAGKAAPVLPFGTYRPTPAFKNTVATSDVPRPAAEPVLVARPVPVQAPVVEPVTVPVTPPAEPIAEATPQPVVPVVPTPVVPAPVAAPAPQPQPQPVSVSNDSGYLERIRQIKTAVNSQVGNPVNLVDINNEVGREYMNALLEAMKKLGSGAVSEMGPAMARLETAYTAVEVAIAAHKGGVTAAPMASVPQPMPVPVPQPAPAQAAVPVPPAPLPVRPIPPPAPAENYQVDSRVPVVDIPAPGPVEARIVPEVEEGRSGFEANTPESNPASLAETKKVLTPKDLPDPATLETGDKGDPLFTKEIDDGLNQLLSDWSLFKKSGLFGTGPKGREHPLYKKIAELQVPLLLAGRFDGANQEIRQSITDYMNGWRYEQGIIYQPGETFEKYLRRVIKHILDLQKKRRPA